jgi:hypothetical protein
MYKYTIEQFISFLESNKIQCTLDRNWVKKKDYWFDIKTNRKNKTNFK